MAGKIVGAAPAAPAVNRSAAGAADAPQRVLTAC